MAQRYGKIYAGPVDKVLPQVHEAIMGASGGLMPGSLVVLSTGEWAAGGTSTVGKAWVLQDHYLTGKGTDDLVPENDTAMGLEILSGMLYNVRVPTGQNIAKGDALVPGASGTFVKLTGNKKMVLGFAEESYNNDTGATQLIRMRGTNGYMSPSSAA